MHVSGNRPGVSKLRQRRVSLVINYHGNLKEDGGENNYKRVMK
jgi:hypothetical protein